MQDYYVYDYNYDFHCHDSRVITFRHVLEYTPATDNTEWKKIFTKKINRKYGKEKMAILSELLRSCVSITALTLELVSLHCRSYFFRYVTCQNIMDELFELTTLCPFQVPAFFLAFVPAHQQSGI